METITDDQLIIEINNTVIDETGYDVILNRELITKIIAVVRKHDANGEYTMNELLNNYNVDDHDS